MIQKDWLAVYLAIATALFLAIFQLTNSFWLDESTTYYVVKDGFSEVSLRVWEHQGQSPLYYWIVSIFTLIFGLSEVSLRLPSLISVLLSSFVVYKIVTIQFDRSAGKISALIFLFLPIVREHAVNARPYGLGLLFEVIAIHSLLMLQVRITKFYSTMFVSFAVLTLYTHYLIFPPLLIVSAVIFIMKKELRFVLITDWIIILASLIPLVPHIKYISQKGHIIQFAPVPSLIGIIEIAFPLIFSLPLIAVIIIFIANHNLKESHSLFRLNYRKFFFGLLIAFVSPIFLAISYFLSGYSNFLDRYCALSSVGLALVCALIINTVSRTLTILRTTSLAFCIYIMVISPGTFNIENWRQAVNVLNQKLNVDTSVRTEVLLWSGLIETNNLSWLNDLTWREYLSAPILPYPVAKPVVLLPYNTFEKLNRNFIDKLIGSFNNSNINKVFLLARFDTGQFDELKQIFIENNFSYSQYEEFGTVQLVEFKRNNT